MRHGAPYVADNDHILSHPHHHDYIGRILITTECGSKPLPRCNFCLIREMAANFESQRISNLRVGEKRRDFWQISIQIFIHCNLYATPCIAHLPPNPFLKTLLKRLNMLNIRVGERKINETAQILGVSGAVPIS